MQEEGLQALLYSCDKGNDYAMWNSRNSLDNKRLLYPVQARSLRWKRGWGVLCVDQRAIKATGVGYVTQKKYIGPLEGCNDCAIEALWIILAILPERICD